MSNIELAASAALPTDNISIYTEDQLTEKYGVRNSEEDWKEIIKRAAKRKCACSGTRMKSFIASVIPIIQWLPNYKVRKYIFGDIIAGLTVGIVHLPQGMAYGLLASLPAVAGLYVSFFPVLIYLLFGTCRHMSVGTFAVVSLMIAQVVNQYATPCAIENLAETTTSPSSTVALSETTAEVDNCEATNNKRKMEIAVALALANGLIQVTMSILRLGIVTTYLSSHMVSAFTCGAAFHVLTSQVPKLLGIPVKRYSGPLALIYTYVDLFKNITSINWATFVISICCVLFLIAGKEINGRFRDRLPIALPWELGIVIFGTMASYFGTFAAKYQVQTVGNIPTGIETSVPKAADIGAVFFSAIPIAIVAFATEISLCQMFAAKHSYKVDADQELLALGFGNVVGSFFSCFPCAPSLSRSVIWEEVGAKTQLTGLFSSVLILIILLWIGPLFESLPQAALAAIIIVNLKGLLKQFVKVPPLWRASKWNALTWAVTWSSVILLGVSLGLAVAVAFEILTVVLRTQTIKGSVIASVGENMGYRDVKKFRTKTTGSDRKVVVFRFPGPIIYANKENFHRQICKALGFDPSVAVEDEPEVQDKLLSSSQDTRHNYKTAQGVTYEERGTTFHDFPISSGSDSEGPFTSGKRREQNTGNGEISHFGDDASRHGRVNISQSNHRTLITHFVTDLQCCPFVDNDGAQAIKSLHRSLLKVNIKLFLVCSNGDVRETLKVVCEECHPPVFVSIAKAMEVATGRAMVEFDEMGDVIPMDQVRRDAGV